MRFKTEYSYDYCCNVAHIMNELFDHQKAFFAPPKDTAAMRGVERRHPAEIEREWYNDPLRKLYFKMIMAIENVQIPKMTITMSKDEFDKSEFNSRLSYS